MSIGNLLGGVPLGDGCKFVQIMYKDQFDREQETILFGYNEPHFMILLRGLEILNIPYNQNTIGNDTATNDYRIIGAGQVENHNQGWNFYGESVGYHMGPNEEGITRMLEQIQEEFGAKPIYVTERLVK